MNTYDAFAKYRKRPADPKKTFAQYRAASRWNTRENISLEKSFTADDEQKLHRQLNRALKTDGNLAGVLPLAQGLHSLLADFCLSLTVGRYVVEGVVYPFPSGTRGIRFSFDRKTRVVFRPSFLETSKRTPFRCSK